MPTVFDTGRILFLLFIIHPLLFKMWANKTETKKLNKFQNMEKATEIVLLAFD